MSTDPNITHGRERDIDESDTQSAGSGDTQAQREAHEAVGENDEPVEGPPEDYDAEAARIAARAREGDDAALRRDEDDAAGP